MPTINQLIRKGRKDKVKKSKRPILNGCPAVKAVVTEVKTRTPKKPNSALRKVVVAKLPSGREITVKVPGIGHNIQAHSIITFKGGGAKDLIGVRYSVIRGALGIAGPANRKQARSKYGVKKPK